MNRKARATSKKPLNPLTNYIFGNLKLHRQLKGGAIPSEQGRMATSINDLIAYAKKHGTHKEQKMLQYVQEVFNSDLWIKVAFMPKTSILMKQAIRDWLISKGFVYADKSYAWTVTVGSASKYVAIGPWSAKPRITTGKAHKDIPVKSMYIW